MSDGCLAEKTSSDICDFWLQIDWNQSAEALHNWIRGNDKVPGAWAEVDGQVIPTKLETNRLRSDVRSL